MDPGIFQFQTMMTTVANGMAGNMIPAIVSVAYIFMIISLMLGVYEAYARGGDTKGLAATVMKFIVVAFIIGNWTRFFSDLSSGFDAIAQQIDNSYGAGDLIKDWGNLLIDNWNTNGYTSIWNLIANGGAAIVNALEIAIAYLIFPIAAQLFTLLYVFWGAVLYAVGPLVLALAPSRMINGTAKCYAQNLFVWNCWAVLYAVFACLITAVNGKDLDSSPFFTGMVAAQPQVWIGLTSILYAVCILLIPIIAMAVLKGEFGGVASAFMSLVSISTQVSRAASGAAKAAKSGTGGSASGRNTSAPQGGSGGGTYQSRPPNPTPPRATVP